MNEGVSKLEKIFIQVAQHVLIVFSLLSCGNPKKVDALFNRVTKVNKSKSFELLFCIGSLFAQDDQTPSSTFLKSETGNIMFNFNNTRMI